MTHLSLVGKRIAVLVEGAGITVEQLNRVLGPRGFAPAEVVATIAELTARLRTQSPSLVVLPLTPSGDRGEALAQFGNELRRHPNVAAIGTSPTKDADLVLGAMRAGILEFLVTPCETDELQAAISRLLALSSGASTQGLIYTVFSAKGGMGTSTIATSLAWELARRQGKQGVTLADFTTAGAGVRVMLNLTPQYDLGSISARSDRIDRDLVRSVMTAHPDGISVLAAADEMDAADQLDHAAAGRLLGVLREEYAFSVIDSDHHFSDLTLAALDAADRIVLVVQLDVAALRSTQRTLALFARLGYPPEKVALVVNRQSERDRISLADAQRVLGRAVTCRLPNDYVSCSDAITSGLFVQRNSPASPLVPAIAALASALDGSPVEVEDTVAVRNDRSRLSRLFGRG
jgi:pilus assembly protein CpaE